MNAWSAAEWVTKLPSSGALGNYSVPSSLEKDVLEPAAAKPEERGAAPTGRPAKEKSCAAGSSSPRIAVLNFASTRIWPAIPRWPARLSRAS